MPSANETGRTLARTTKYVGEHAENTGPSAAPMTTSPQNPPRWYPAASRRFEPRLTLPTKGRRSHNDGNIRVTPNPMMMSPESNFQNISGTPIKAVDALRRSVKTKSETPREPMMMNARFLLAPPPSTEPPTITGRMGRMQGASTVKMPAMNEMTSSTMIIILFLRVLEQVSLRHPTLLSCRLPHLPARTYAGTSRRTFASKPSRYRNPL